MRCLKTQNFIRISEALKRFEKLHPLKSYRQNALKKYVNMYSTEKLKIRKQFRL
jgi:hypothetical protein